MNKPELARNRKPSKKLNKKLHKNRRRRTRTALLSYSETSMMPQNCTQNTTEV